MIAGFLLVHRFFLFSPPAALTFSPFIQFFPLMIAGFLHVYVVFFLSRWDISFWAM
jgi:hypothetical protein